MIEEHHFPLQAEWTVVMNNDVVATAQAPTVTVQPNTGGGAAVPNMQPYLVLNYCIATQGIFPSRN